MITTEIIITYISQYNSGKLNVPMLTLLNFTISRISQFIIIYFFILLFIINT